MKAIWKGRVIAESDDTVVVEGNHYFPAATVNPSMLRDSTRTSYCPWKGTANYYTLTADGEESESAAWYYARPKDKAKQLTGRVAFWRDVKVVA